MFTNMGDECDLQRRLLFTTGLAAVAVVVNSDVIALATIARVAGLGSN